jgi:hypothetical protein
MSQFVPKFNPELLLGGYTDIAQLQNWFMGKSNSIYVKWVPDEMTEKDAANYFSILGLIKRVEFVPHKNGNSRMLFVHFEEWNNSPFSLEIRSEIVNAYPGEHSMPISYNLVTGVQKTYQLKCCVNVRPIPTVEYNTHQLTDMFERLNDRVTNEMSRSANEMKEMREEMQLLKYEVARLNAIVDAYEENANYTVIYPEDSTEQNEELELSDSADIKDNIE